MQRCVWLAASGLFFLLADSAVAATPADAAAGIYYARYPGALFAFRVDPWTDDVHAVRGLVRGALDDEHNVVFAIRGTYRPGAAHTVQGMFLLYDGDAVRQIPWKGMYDREQQAFTWAADVAGEVKSLTKAAASTAEDRAAVAFHRQKFDAAAAIENANRNPPTSRDSTTTPEPNASGAPAPASASPTSPSPKSTAAPTSSAFAEPTTALFQRSSYLKEVVDEKGELDFSKVIVRVIDVTPDKPRTQQPDRNLVEDLNILSVLTDVGKGSYQEKDREQVEWIIDNYAQGILDPRRPIPTPIRKRAEIPPLDPPRVLKRLVKPEANLFEPFFVPKPTYIPIPGPGYPGRDEPPATAPKTVPNVVGLSVEGATAAIWGAGLNVSGIECLGQSTDPTKADRVTSQTPAAGSPVPTDGNLTLQWFSKPTDASVPSPVQAVETKPADPAPTTTATAAGFQPGDGAKVEGRFGGAEVYADGKGIAFASGGAEGGLNWMIGKSDEPLFQQGIAATKSAIQRLSQTQSVGKFTATITRSGPGLIDLTTSNGDGTGNTYCYQYEEYRGFFINYAESVNTPGAALSAKAAAAIEKSRRLIDLRFPK